jgi:type IV pilus assembly protein PilE
MKCKEPFLNRRSPGFTLIELMIVIAVLSALAAIAIPSYRNYNMKANRSAAAQIMLNIQNREEQYVLDARSYMGNLGSSGLNISHDGWTCTNDTTIPSTSKCSNSFYDVAVTLTAGPPIGYTIVATSKNYQVADGNLTLTSTGTRSRSAGDGKW